MKQIIKKKIIISTYDDLSNPVYSGGGAYSVHEVAKRLANKYDVRVLTGTYSNARNKVLDKVRYIRIGSDIFGHKIGQILFQYAILKYARTYDYDIWIESSTPPFTFSLLPWFAKTEVISWIHMFCSFDIRRKYKVDIRTFEKELSKNYKYAIVSSDWVKNVFRAMNHKAKVKLIPLGFDEKIIKNSVQVKNNFNKYILFMGRIEINQKGLDLLIKAFAHTGQKISLVIAGSGCGKEEDKMGKLIRKCGLENRIRVLGRVAGDRKENLYKNAEAVVIPSRFETFSLTALEAIMHQKPIICFDIPQLAWIPAKFADKLSPFKIKQLADSIKTVRIWKKKKRISKKDKDEYLKKHNWSNTADEIDNFIAKIIG